MYETLEPRLTLSVDLRHGAVNDEVLLTPTSDFGRYTLVNSSIIDSIPPIIDLSVLAEEDQRISLPLEDNDQFLQTVSTIGVDASQSYRFVTYRQESEASSVTDSPFHFAYFDADMNRIESIHTVKYQFAADTRLATDLLPGSDAIFIEDASGWSNTPWEPGATRALAWYGYSDSSGTAFADYTYTRNVASGETEGLWRPGDIRYDPFVTAYRIDLIEPWDGPRLAAGLAVRNAVEGVLENRPDATVMPGVLDDYVSYQVTLGGTSEQSGILDENSFVPGTEFVLPMLPSGTEWLGLEVAPLEDAIDFGPLDLRQVVVELNSTHEAVINFDVLSKGVFGQSTTLIDSISAPARGSASVVTAESVNVIQFRVVPGDEDSIELGYTLRNAVTDEVFESSITIRIAAVDFAIRRERLFQVGIGFLNYQDIHGRLPVLDNPAYFNESGIPHLSWRVHLLPMVGRNDLYSQFHLDEPWDSANNLPLATMMPGVFADPKDPSNTETTRYQIISGLGDEFLWHRNADGRRVGRRFADFFDGVRNSLLVVETSADVAVPWTQPDVPNFDYADPLASIGTPAEEYFLGWTARGATLALPTDIDPQLFTALVTIKGLEDLDANTVKRKLAQQYGGVFALAFEDPPYVSFTREESYFGQLKLGLLTFNDARRYFPIDQRAIDDGTPLLSWRVMVLPQLGYTSLYDRFSLNEPWDSPTNLPLLDSMPDVFRSTGDPYDSNTTRIQTFTYESGEPEVGLYVPPREGTGWTDLQRGVSYSSFSDGTTISFVEAGSDKAVPWTAPADLAFNFDDPLATLGDISESGFRASLLLSSPLDQRHYSPDILPELFKAMATRSGGESVSPSDWATNVTTETERKYSLVARAMLDYERAYGRFPSNTFAADGTPLLSWRVELLPFLNYENLYNAFRHDEPWDSEHNFPLLDVMPDVFRSAEDRVDSNVTRIQNFVGDDVPFPESGTSRFEGPRVLDITDGLDYTVAFAEAGSDAAVPWTKPADIPYNSNNPYSAMGELGDTYWVSLFSGQVKSFPSDDNVDSLSAGLTHQGALSSLSPSPGVYVRQSHGDTTFSEFGVDWFEVVLDSFPYGEVAVEVSVTDSAAVLDRTNALFNNGNWNVPQRFSLRATDNRVPNVDYSIEVTLRVDEASSSEEYRNLASQTFLATILDDDLHPGDFNLDGVVNSTDLDAWQSLYGEPGGPDSDLDADTDGTDFLNWQRNMNERVSREDFNYDGVVDAVDLWGWQRAYSQDARADSDQDGDTDGSDFLAWQRGIVIVPVAGDLSGDDVVDLADLQLWQVAYGDDSRGDVDRDGDSDGMDFLAWQTLRSSTSPAIVAASRSADLIDAVLGAVELEEESADEAEIVWLDDQLIDEILG